MSGRLRRVTGSSVSRQAARIGRAAFLLPPGRIVPSSRLPPSTMNRSMAILAANSIRSSNSPGESLLSIPMIVAPLGSGSAGNAYYFESDGTSILVDAGLGPRETRKRLELVDRNIELLKAIVVTHEHYDHIRGAERIARKYGIPLYLTRGTLNASRIEREDMNIVVFENN